MKKILVSLMLGLMLVGMFATGVDVYAKNMSDGGGKGTGQHEMTTDNSGCQSFTIFGITIKHCPGDKEKPKKSVIVEGDSLVVLDGKGASDGVWSNLFQKYNKFARGIYGLALITTIGIFIRLALKLGVTAGNPAKRSEVLMGDRKSVV